MSLRQPIESIERGQHGDGQHTVLKHDVVEPMAWKRGVGFGHVASRLVASCFCSVVLASHSSLFEKATRTVAGIDNKVCGTARTRKLLQRIDQHGAHALPGGRRMNI